MVTTVSGTMPQAQGRGKNRRPLAAVKTLAYLLLPVVALGAALAMHLLLPDRQMVTQTTHYTLTGAYKWVLIFLAALYVIVNLVSLGHAGLRGKIRHFVPLAAVGILLLIVWDTVTLKTDWLHLPFFPSPDMLFDVFATGWRLLGVNLGASLRLFASGLVIGTVIGLGLGLAIGWNRRCAYWLTPVQKLVGSIPATAWLPIIIVLAPTTFMASIFLLSLSVVFPVSVMTSTGISNVKNSYFEVARTLGASRSYLIFRVAIPAALPSIFTGIFMAFCSSFLMLMVAEMVGVKAGIGWYIPWAEGMLQYQNVYAALIIISVICSGLISLLFLLKDKILVWQKGLLKW